MPDIHIERSHTLGMTRAREVARVWVAQATQAYGLECDYQEGDAQDFVEIAGTGIDGSFEVTGDSFVLHAQLGFLYGHFSEMIENKVARNLDELLADEAAAASNLPPHRA